MRGAAEPDRHSIERGAERGSVDKPRALRLSSLRLITATASVCHPSGRDGVLQERQACGSAGILREGGEEPEGPEERGVPRSGGKHDPAAREAVPRERPR